MVFLRASFVFRNRVIFQFVAGLAAVSIAGYWSHSDQINVLDDRGDCCINSVGCDTRAPRDAGICPANASVGVGIAFWAAVLDLDELSALS